MTNRLPVAVLFFVALVSGCGTSSGEGGTVTTTTTTVVVISGPEEIAFRYVESGGIGGDTVVDLVVYGDGTGTISAYDGESRPIAVPVAELNRILVDLEAAGVHDLDQADHPEVSVADGFAQAITVHSVNGSSEVGAYGLGEMPQLFGDDWHRLFDTGRQAAADIDPRS